MEVDSWKIFERVFKETMEEKIERKISPKTVSKETFERTSKRDKKGNPWFLGFPDEPGDYIASKDCEDCWARHWNGRYWSKAWAYDMPRAIIVAEKNAKKYGERSVRRLPFREDCLGSRAPDQNDIWFIPAKLA